MTSLWCNVSVNVVPNSNWSCSLISAPKDHWSNWPLPDKAESGRFNQMHGRIARVSTTTLPELECRPVLHDTSNLAVDRVQFRAVWRPQISSSESEISHCSSGMVSQARWASALSASASSSYRSLTSCAGGRHNMLLLTVTLTFWSWKWCPSHVWRGLPVRQL